MAWPRSATRRWRSNPGDFLGFATPSPAHHLRNPFGEDLVFLQGGERHPAEVADFPRLGKRSVRVGMRVSVHAIDAAEGFPPFPRVEDDPG